MCSECYWGCLVEPLGLQSALVGWVEAGAGRVRQAAARRLALVARLAAAWQVRTLAEVCHLVAYRQDMAHPPVLLLRSVPLVVDSDSCFRCPHLVLSVSPRLLLLPKGNDYFAVVIWLFAKRFLLIRLTTERCDIEIIIAR